MPHTSKAGRYPTKKERREERRKKMVGRMSYVRERLNKMGVPIVEETASCIVVTYHCEPLRFYPWTGTFANRRGVGGKYAENFFALLAEENKRKNY